MDPQLNAITLAVKARSSWTKYRVLYEQWERSDRERLIDGIMKDYMELETMKLKVDNGVITKQAALNGHRRMSPNVAPWKGKEPQTIGAIWLPQIRKRQSRLRAALFRVGGYKALDTLQSSIQHIQARFENLVDHSEEGKQQENVPKNDGSAISKDEYEYAQNGLNEIFAHEMMIDVEKFIKELETPEAYTKLLIIAKQAYRDRLQQALCTSGDAEPEKVSVDKQFVRLIAEVRDKLVAVLLQNAGEATENCKWRLENLLDMDILRNQICHYAFTVEDAIQLLKLFTEALRTIQADEELKNWEDSWFSEIANFDCSLQVQKRKLLSIVGQKLCDILDRLDMIEKDIIISKIRILEPVLKCYGPQWEDTRFQEKIHTGTFEKQLPQTSIWLTNSMKRLKQVYTTFDCLHLIQEGEGVYLKRFLQASFIYLIEYKDENIVPEVLKLDERRLLMLRENLYKCVYFTSFDLIVRRFVKQKNIEWDSTIEQRWRDLLVFWKEKNLTSLETHMNKELLSFMETIFQGQSEILLSQQDKAFLFSLWRQVVCGNEPISSLLKRRIVDFLYRTFLFHVSWTNPRKQLHSLGFGIVVDDIIDMLETMKQTTIHMLAVHLYRLKPIVLRIAKVIVNE